MIIRVILCLLFLFLSLGGYSQSGEQPNPLSVGLRSHYGFIIPHSKAISDVAYSNPYGVEADISRFFTTLEAWEKCNCYSKAGISIIYFNFDNPAILGSTFFSTVYFEPVLARRNRLFLSLRTEIGFAYLTNIYDEITNPLNLFFGARLSFPLRVSLHLNYRLNETFYLNISGYFNHISNGGIKQPNKGMNFPTASIGLTWYFNSLQFEDHTELKNRIPISTNYHFSCSVFGTLKTVSKTGNYKDKNMFICGFTVNMSKNIGRFTNLVAGFEFISDGYAREKMHREGIDKDHNKLAFMAGHKLTMGRIIFTQQLAAYLYAPYEYEEVYQRYCLLYRITDRLAFGTSLKAHKNVADVFDVRLTVLF